MASSYETEPYKRLQRLIKALAHIDTKKQLRQAAAWVQKDYAIFKRFLRIDGRLAPARTKAEFAQFKPRALKFKSEALGYDLTNSDIFDANDWYDSSYKLAAVVTDAMMAHAGNGIFGLESMTYQNEMIHIGYKKEATKKVLTFTMKGTDFTWLENLPENVMINIRGTAYNKPALQFAYDYYNQSNDFAEYLNPWITDETIIKFYWN